jgi:thioredoxin domain-containing protein 5
MQHIAPEDKDFSKKVTTGRWIVFHHMNGCMHCVMFRPAWNDAKALSKSVPINVTECEYGDMKRLPASMQKVMGFPTVMVYEDAKPKAAFNGPRTAEDLAEFFKSYVKRPTTSRGKIIPKSAPPKKKSASKKT